MTLAAFGSEGGDGPSYSYRASAMGAPRVFRLSGQSLEWDTGRRSGRVELRRITNVRMSYRPVTMQSQRFVTEIWSPESPRLTIISTSVKGLFEQVRLDQDYRNFILEFHARAAAAGGATRFVSGIHPLMFGVGLLLFIGAGLGVMGLIVRAIQADALFGALLIGVFLAFLVWHASNFFYRNRPARYRPDMPPEKLLPLAQG
jgi:hypothetical protein